MILIFIVLFLLLTILSYDWMMKRYTLEVLAKAIFILDKEIDLVEQVKHWVDGPESKSYMGLDSWDIYSEIDNARMRGETRYVKDKKHIKT